MSLQIVQVRNDLLSKLGVDDPAEADALTLQDVLIAINGAGQILQTAGQDYFTREIITVGIAAGTSIYPIPGSVQAILGPVRLNDEKPLDALESQGQYDQYDRLFNGGTGYGPGDGEPQAYWPKYTKIGNTGDICAVDLYIAPRPTAADSLTIEVVKDWVELEIADLDSTNELPVAQNYTESIFLPIARMLVTRSRIFARPDLREQLIADGQYAMQRLGVSGGFPNEEQPRPPRRTEG
jgi:hypothetical protein